MAGNDSFGDTFRGILHDVPAARCAYCGQPAHPGFCPAAAEQMRATFARVGASVSKIFGPLAEAAEDTPLVHVPPTPAAPDGNFVAMDAPYHEAQLRLLESIAWSLHTLVAPVANNEKRDGA